MIMQVALPDQTRAKATERKLVASQLLPSSTRHLIAWRDSALSSAKTMIAAPAPFS